MLTPEDVTSACARFQFEWERGSRERAREVAVEFCGLIPAELRAYLERYSREGLVTLIDGYRDAMARDPGNAFEYEESRVVADMWLLANYDPQNIVGEIGINMGDVLRAASDAIERGRS